MLQEKIIIRFTDVAVQPSKAVDEHAIQRLVGFVDAKSLLPLFDNADLDANPRSARVGNVTSEILITLKETPELFHFKSKGILLGTANFEALQRNRYLLEFEDPMVEGILDGGHNMLAIGLHILRGVMDPSEWKKIKFWDEMKTAWIDHREAIEESKDDLAFLVPVELLVPSADEADILEAFAISLLDICAARNNNAQLTQEAKSQKRGFYDAIRDRVPEEFGRRVEWRANAWDDDEEKKPIKIRDLVALSWIPLNFLNEHNLLPFDISVTPQNIYRNKGECSAKFDLLMSHNAVTQREEGFRHSLVHDAVGSAFDVLVDLPDLYDQIYEDFPEAYNSHNLRFGANPIVKIYAPDRRAAAKAAGRDVSGYAMSQPLTPFMRRPVDYNYPDGLIVPLVYGLKGIMRVKGKKVVWAVDDPCDFVKRQLPALAGAYKLVLDMPSGTKWDPQKIAKNPASHEFAVREFRNALAEERHRD